jgi:hypothetical protein
MSRKNTYLVILSTYADETLAMARILRLRARRKVAEQELIQRRRLAALQQVWADGRMRIERAVDEMKIGRDR